MVQISLKKILAKKECLSVINDLGNAIDLSISILDAEGNLLIGNACDTSSAKYPVELSGEAIGWVIGEEKAFYVASILSYLANKELEKKTLANELLDKYREITLLHDISQKITASLDLKEVTKLVIDEARKLIEATSGSVMLLNEKTGRIETIASLEQEFNSKATTRLGEGIVGSVVKAGKGEIVNDVLSDPRFVESQELLRALICVPLKTKDKVIGAIAFGNSSQAVTYTAEDLKLLNLLAFQAASAIENALLHENKLKESRREALLFRLASQIRLSLDLNTILETAVSEIRSLLQIDRCQFIWHRPHGTQSAWEVVNDARNPELPGLLGYYSAVELGCFTQQLLSMEMVQIDSVATLSDPVMQQFFVWQGFTSVLALPIKTRSGAIGAVSCGHCTEIRPWSESEVELLQAVANQLAIALDQAELYEQSRTAAQIAQAQAQHLASALHELKHTQAQLIQSEKMSSLGQLVAGVAHEINNPVNFICGNLTHAHQYTQDLLDLLELYQQNYPQPVPEIQAQVQDIELDFLAEDLPKLISSMHLGVDRIRQIVRSLRNFSRLEEAEMKPVDIHEGIDSTLLILQSRLKATAGRPGIQVIKEYGKLPPVECYACHMNQVFMNILNNAIDALETQEAPRIITINTETRREGRNFPLSGSVVIRIADNGPGMTETVRKKLFDPFFTTKPVGKGTGLGLSISYQIVVDKHGGVLKCLSQPGQGAEFWIEIPLTQGAAVRQVHMDRGVPASKS